MITDTAWFLGAFIVYLGIMVSIGIYFAGKNSDSEDYFLGGRNLGAFVAAFSAQASDMSGWSLMGLPGSIYALGTGQSWIAIGLLIGTVANWFIVSGRLRKYTIKANNSLTLPMFFENRYHDKKRILLLVSSITIVVFFLVYTASAFAAGGKLFNSVFGVDYTLALTIGAVVILAYTFMGGFMAVCTTDLVQGIMMLVGILFVPIAAAMLVGVENIPGIIDQSGVPGGSASFLSLTLNGERPYTFVEIISQLAWGLGYFGMPHVLVRFMAVKDDRELDKSKWIASIWVLLDLLFACVIGIVGRAYLFPKVLEGGEEEKVFIEMIIQLFTKDYRVPLLGGLFLCGILAAIMSTADSQLLVSASSVAEDIYKGIAKKDADDKQILKISRITVLAIAVLAYLIALNPNSSIMGLVADAWAGLGAAFGPLVLASLFWKRTNTPGAVAGIITGGVTVILWDYIPFVNGQTIGSVTSLYSLLPGFIFSLIAIIIVSLVTPAPSEEVVKEFEAVSGK
ncbi:MAG: sodium/proline symporter PutP [Lachnospiraceae bacterium]|nr:sodium/proline symporter PutP [Lachnospiraceae bacterium]